MNKLLLAALDKLISRLQRVRARLHIREIKKHMVTAEEAVRQISPKSER